MSQDEAQNAILKKANVEISPQTQETLNKPLEHPQGIDEKDKALLTMLAEKIEKGEIKLYTPNSLFNHAVYDKLSEEDKGRSELDAFNMLSTVREIYKLWQAGQRNTYQLENLVHKMRVTKERLEEIGGDIFII